MMKAFKDVRAFTVKLSMDFLTKVNKMVEKINGF